MSSQFFNLEKLGWSNFHCFIILRLHIDEAGVSLCAPKLIQDQFSDIKFDDLQSFRMEYGDNRVSVNVVDNIDGNFFWDNMKTFFETQSHIFTKMLAVTPSAS